MNPIRGRGASANPAGRFEPLRVDPDPEESGEEAPSPATRFFETRPRTALTRNESPDVGMGVTLNPYRGCEHGCSYCYARPTHEYFGLSAGLDFETKILVKRDAPELLRKELASPRWKPQVVTMSGVTDCYQPAERRFGITRRCLQVFRDFRNPVVVITKNRLVTRDKDVLAELAAHNAAAVFLSVTTLDAGLARAMEPRTSAPRMRLDAIRELAEAGVPAGVMVAPVVPGLTDHEIPAILEAAAAAGARRAGTTVLRLPYGVKDVFVEWLKARFPEKAARVIGRIREVRGGRLNDPSFGSRMEGTGAYAAEIALLFSVAARKHGLDRPLDLSVGSFRRPAAPDLFA
jgi:DNA repair photolyase